MSNHFNASVELLNPNLIKEKANSIAYIDENGSYSFSDLDRAVKNAADLFRNVGLKEKDRLLITMLDRFSLPVAFLAAIRSGIVPILTNTLLTGDDYRYILKDSGACFTLVSPELIEPFSILQSEGLLENIITEEDFSTTSQSRSTTPPIAVTTANDHCFWLYSSGSTGRPKGTIHIHSSLSQTATIYAHPILALKESDIIFSAAKLFFAYGLGNSLSFPLSVGATAVLMSERPTPASVFEHLVKYQATIFFGVPTLYSAMLADENFPKIEELNLRLCVSAGEPLPEDLGKRWQEKTGLEILDGIGSTEMLHIFLSNQSGRVRYGTTGEPIPGYELRIVNDKGLLVEEGEIGELHVKGPTSAVEYWNQPKKTRTTFLGKWTRTGDKYRKDSDGYYVYCGRSDDMLKVGGIYVSPTEVESCLVAHPSVLEAAVVGREDNERLVKPEAFVVLNRNHGKTTELAQELQSHVKGSLAPYKYPRWVHFVDDLPKTATGKIQRYKLRRVRK